jgi:hypothetical protein
VAAAPEKPAISQAQRTIGQTNSKKKTLQT